MNLSLPESITDLAGLLRHVDAMPAAMSPLDLDKGLGILLQRNPNAEAEAGRPWRDEVAAFVMKLLPGDQEPWGLTYAPMHQTQDESGNLQTFPDLATLGGETLAYWRHRARTSRNPGLRGRYADLSWVFAKTFGERPDRADALLALEAFNEFVLAVPPEKEFDAIRVGQRAMALALSLRDEAWQLKAKQALFQLAKALEPKPLPLYRSFLLDSFGLGPFSKVELSPTERDHMVGLLEDQLQRELSNTNPSESTGVWYAQNATQLLLSYYRVKGQDAEVNRVLEAFASVVHQRADLGAPLAGQAWLGDLSRICLEHGRRDLSTRALQALEALGPKAMKAMRSLSATTEVPKEEIDKILSLFTEADLGTGLRRLTSMMVPKVHQVRANTETLMAQAPLRFAFGSTLMDGKGRPVVEVPSYSTHPKAYLPMAFAEHIGVDGFLRSLVLEAIRSRFNPTPEEITDWLQASPVYPPERRPLLIHGIRAYLNGDWITAIHVLIPQIEEAARTLAGLLGESIFKWETEPDGIRRLDVRSLNQVLDSPHILQIFGEDHATFLRVALVRNQGMNLRNRVAHGLMLPAEYSEGSADIVFQCLLTLGMIRPKRLEGDS